MIRSAARGSSSGCRPGSIRSSRQSFYRERLTPILEAYALGSTARRTLTRLRVDLSRLILGAAGIPLLLVRQRRDTAATTSAEVVTRKAAGAIAPAGYVAELEAR